MAIAAHEITLGGFDYPFRVLDFAMELKPNAHGRANLLLQMSEEPDLSRNLVYGSKLTIGYHTDEENTGILFCGIVNHISLEHKDQHYKLSVSLATGSIALDRHLKQMAYQDDTLTYGQVLTSVLSQSDGAMAVMAMGNDQPIGGMLVQYKETDWVFIQRLASHLGEAVFPDWRTGAPALYFGTELEGVEVDVSLFDYITILDDRFYTQGGFLAGLNKRDFLYYRIQTGVNFELGTRTVLQGKTQRILRKCACLDGDQVIFTYDWGASYKVKRHYNESMTGAMLAGTVIETVDERVRIVLDIDAVMPTIFHNWTPMTGNHFYCMPELSTRVMLYLGGRTEDSAKAVENIRTNGAMQLRAETDNQIIEEREYNEKMLDYNNRYFASQAGKELSVLPSSIGFGPRNSSPQIVLDDKSGVMIRDMSMTFQAQGMVAFDADMISITAPSQVSMIRSGNGPTSTFNISGDFNVCGTIGSMTGTQKTAARITKSTVAGELDNTEEIQLIAISSIAIGYVEDIETYSLIRQAEFSIEEIQSAVLAGIPNGNVAH